MGIILQVDETYESWSTRVHTYEIAIAKQQIAKGIPINEVLERMSKNITKKLLHPLLKAITNVPVDLESLAESKKSYEETYINKVPKAADHVDD